MTSFPNIKVSVGQQDRTTIKGRVVARFPAQVWGAQGIAVTKAAGAYTIANDWGALASDPSVDEPDRTHVPVYLEALGDQAEAMRRVTFAAFVLAVAAAIDLEALAEDIYDAGLVGDMFKATYDANNDGVVDDITGATARAQGSEGGQINLEKASGSTLAGPVAVDVNGATSFRVFEQGGTARGVYIDITECAGGAGSKVLHTGNVTAAGQALLDDADAATQRTTLGLAALATKATVDSAALVADSILTFAKLASAAICDQSTAEAGTATDKLMTPQRTAQAIVAKSPATKAATWTKTEPSGVIEKGGKVAAGASSGTVNFAAAFPNACAGVFFEIIGSSGAATSYAAILDGEPSASSFSWYLRQTAAGGATGPSTAVGFFWRAIGY